MEIHQFSCREKNNIDLRQAKAVIKHKPDIIILEAPSETKTASLVFSSSWSIKKQEEKLKKIILSRKKVEKNYPWVISDIKIFENAIDLSAAGRKIKIYNVDAPSDLLRETIINKWDVINNPRRRGVHFLWWVYIYLREKIMAKNIRPLIKRDDPCVLIFLQKFHWLNVKFFLTNPTKDEVWCYYFRRFKKISKQNITEEIKTKNKVLYRYWLEYSDFA